MNELISEKMKHKEIKGIKAYEVLDILQQLVQDNLDTIEENSNEINVILQTEPASKEREDTINFFHNLSVDLVKKNNKYMDLHSCLLDFLKHMKNMSLEDERKNEVSGSPMNNPKPDISDVFAKTVEGKMKFDTTHPYFRDTAFKDRLMNFYIQNEEYEKCAILSSH